MDRLRWRYTVRAIWNQMCRENRNSSPQLGSQRYVQCQIVIGEKFVDQCSRVLESETVVRFNSRQLYRQGPTTSIFVGCYPCDANRTNLEQGKPKNVVLIFSSSVNLRITLSQGCVPLLTGDYCKLRNTGEVCLALLPAVIHTCV